MLPSHSGSFRLFRFSGIQVYLHWSWFVVALIELHFRRGQYTSLAWNVAEYLALFLIVLLHEFGHSLACRQTGGQADQIILWPLGGIAFVRPPARPGAELWSIAAGPLVNVALVPVIWGLIWARVHLGWGIEYPDYRQFLTDLNRINLVLLVFNLLPVYPLDGGQILRSLLWYAVGRARSLQIASIIGAVGVVLLVGALLLWVPGWRIMTLLMAFFLGQQCLAGFRHARLLLQLEKLPRHTGYRCASCGQSPPGGPMWGCPACGNRFDPFSTAGVCPHCATARPGIPCAHCGAEHTLAQWGFGRQPRSGVPPTIDV